MLIAKIGFSYRKNMRLCLYMAEYIISSLVCLLLAVTLYLVAGDYSRLATNIYMEWKMNGFRGGQTLFLSSMTLL